MIGRLLKNGVTASEKGGESPPVCFLFIADWLG